MTNKKYTLPKEIAKHYSRAKAQAKFRGEEWAFTEWDWWSVWESSGVYEHRGKQPHQYCMARKDPMEAWSPANCVIIPRRQHYRKNAYVGWFGYPNMPWEDRHDVRNK